MPTISEYCGKNSTMITFANGNWLAYSYKTLIGFCCGGNIFLHENDWSSTTGKHLDALPQGKNQRCSAINFFAAFQKHWPQITNA